MSTNSRAISPVRTWRFSNNVPSAKSLGGGYPTSNVGYIMPPPKRSPSGGTRPKYADPTAAYLHRVQSRPAPRAKSPVRAAREKLWSYSNQPEFIYSESGTNVQVGTPKAVVVSVFQSVNGTVYPMYGTPAPHGAQYPTARRAGALEPPKAVRPL